MSDLQNYVTLNSFPPKKRPPHVPLMMTFDTSIYAKKHELTTKGEL